MKYATQISELKNCPPKTCKKATRTAYRFVFDDKNEAVNFTPCALLEPKRLNELSEVLKCSSFGLSFFDTAMNAESHFKKLTLKFPMIYKKLGGLLAQVEITPDHGFITQPVTASGHFTVHESQGAKWNWKILKTLI